MLILIGGYKLKNGLIAEIRHIEADELLGIVYIAGSHFTTTWSKEGKSRFYQAYRPSDFDLDKVITKD